MDGIRGSGCLVQDVSRVGIVQWVGGWLVGPWSRVVLLEEVQVRSTTITSEQKLQIFIHMQKLYRTTPDLFRNTGTYYLLAVGAVLAYQQIEGGASPRC